MAGREIVNRQLSIFIQTGDAQKALDILFTKQKKLTDEITRTTDPKKIQQLRSELTRLAEPIDRATKKVKGELEPSLKDTETTAGRLRNQLKRMSESDSDFSKVTAQYRQANKELDEQRTKTGLISRAWRSFWQEAKTVAVGVIIGNTIQSALQTVLGYVTGIVTGSAKIADELSNIEKTTGLTAEQVSLINRELAKIDTRTSRSDLRKLATEAGKLGKESAEDIIRFVKEADKIKVALGEDLGDDAVLTIAKLSKIFKTEILNIGSVINEIGANSEASEQFTVDFLKRTAGVGPAVRLSADQLAGYSAALEIAGQTTEVSGTAINSFLIDFVKNTEKFGKEAGFKKGELTDLLNLKGTNEAFLTFLERLKSSSGSTQDFLNKMQQLGIDGTRGANVLLALANNIGTVREQQVIAGNAIKSGTSIINEFNKKNNNAAAELDKFRKNLAGVFQSQGFLDAGAAAIRLMSSFVNVLKSIPEFIKENRFALLTLTAGILLMNRAYLLAGASSVFFRTMKIIETAAVAAGTFIMNIARASVVAYTVASAVLARGLTVARGAQLLWNAAMGAGVGPLGIVLVTIGALIIGIGKLFSRTKELTALQQLQKNVLEKTNELLGDQEAKIQILLKTAQDERIEMGKRKAAMEELIKINPDFAATLKINAAGHLEGAEAIAEYIKQLRLQTEAEAKRLILTDKTRQKIELFNNIRTQTGLPNASDEQIENLIRQQATKRTNIFTSIADESIKLIAKDAAGLLDQVNSLQKDIANTTAPPVKKTTDATTDLKEAIAGLGTETEETTGKLDDQKNKLQELEDELKKIREELNLAGLQGFDRELAELEIKYAKLRERAKGNNRLLLVIQNLHEAELSILQKKYRDIYLQQLDEKMKAEEKRTQENQEKLSDIAVAGLKSSLQKLEAAFARVNRDRLAGAELDAITATGRNRLKAELALLEEQRRQELLNKDLTENEKLLIEEKYRTKRREAEIENIKRIIEITIFFLQGALNIDKIFSDAATQRENTELESDRRLNDTKKRNLDTRLKAGTISQLQYDREIQKIEKQQEAREREARRKQFERDKRAQLVNAIINNAGAVTTTLSKFGPPIPPNFLGIAAMALTLITGLSQIGVIIGSKPPAFAKGGKLNGRYHSEGGNPILDGSGRKIGEIEKDEGIINRFSMGDRKSYTVTGTPSQIASKINSLHGGVHWEGGAKLIPAWRNVQHPAINYPAIQKYYAAGGTFSNAQTTGAAAQDNKEMKDTLMVLTSAVLELKEQMQIPIIAYTLLSDQEKQQLRLDAIRKDATMAG